MPQTLPESVTVRLERDPLSPRWVQRCTRPAQPPPQSPGEGLSHPSRRTGPQAPRRGPNTAHGRVSEPDTLC